MSLSDPQILLLIVALFNVVVFCVYWWDKQAAIDGTWRISESTLLWLAFVGGSVGAVAAQQTLRHKTRKEPFRTILIAIVVVHLVVAAAFLLVPDLVPLLIAEISRGS